MLKKMISFIILVLILFSSFSITSSAWVLNESEGEAEAYFLYNFENDLVMAQKNADKTINASSAVKIMTACVALESGIPLDEIVTITDEMLINVSGRFMGLKIGDRMSFRDLLYSMINTSFNDAAHAIAFTVSDSLEGFIAKMNEKAQALGMNSTTFYDITGMSTESRTSVSDIVKLSKYMSENEDYLEITATKTYQLSSVATCEYNKITNRSTLFSQHKGLANFNTGSSVDDKDSTVIYLKNAGFTYLAIVMNARSNKDGNIAEKYVDRMLYHALYDYSNRVIMKGNKTVASLPVKYSISDDEIDVLIKEDVSAYLPDDVDIDNEISYSYYIYNNELKAPLKIGDEVGVIVISQNGRFIASSKLTVSESVDRNLFLYVLDVMKEFITSRTFLFSLLFFGILMALHYVRMTAFLKKMFKGEPRKALKYYRK